MNRKKNLNRLKEKIPFKIILSVSTGAHDPLLVLVITFRKKRICGAVITYPGTGTGIFIFILFIYLFPRLTK